MPVPLTMALLTKVLFSYSHNLQSRACYLFHNHILQSHLFDICSHGIYCILRCSKTQIQILPVSPFHTEFLEITKYWTKAPPQVSRDIWICNFFFPGMASVHTHPVNSAANPGNHLWIRSPERKKNAMNPIKCGWWIWIFFNPTT